mmetsp:Transcript_24828/g.34222  ORF Transcript_24828/g.34222 Transcript_24828/m.34222 type:complete len:268 (+) Transcript_24828:113-916(+)|eukprot:CAMPEP_0196577906 /NCGR_PEP_ID=MMETSP1081-20130531/6909_1 /TAXON_ID=36882 /ORGANISM="Pyramimonas amylifera, Strain CCMP720" /LENGTH=267 /DNA_ID=CAMNT_0041896965 /DNA_START=112 /DNA_END=915 /DNA_ORIENTATION=-
MKKKRVLRKALEDGKPVPTELRGEAGKLRGEIDLEDENTREVRSHVDDEYARAAEQDPKVLITTSRDPSTRLAQFAKEMKLIFPGSQRVNRGGQVLGEIVEAARNNGYSDIVMLHEHRGEPDGLVVCHLPFGPTAYFGVVNTVLRHDIKDSSQLGKMKEVAPHLVLNNFTSGLGERVGNVLKHLFPQPKEESKRIITFANEKDYISFRHHVYTKPKGDKSIELSEVGPRFELRLYQLRLGTMDSQTAEVEWAIRPYMHSGKKQRLAS